MTRYGRLDMSEVSEDLLSQLLSTTPEGIIALLVVILDRQGAINIDDVKYALDLFDKRIPYPFICVEGGVNRYKEIIDLLRKGESVAIKGCGLHNIKRALRRAGVEAEIIKVGNRHYLLRPKVTSNEQ
jgi:uncharacterized metal-binding protein